MILIKLDEYDGRNGVIITCEYGKIQLKMAGLICKIAVKMRLEALTVAHESFLVSLRKRNLKGGNSILRSWCVTLAQDTLR